MRKVQKGFTMIELMIVVAIIGILAAVAVPAYQNYIQRTKVAGSVVGANAFKMGVLDCIMNNNADATLCVAGAEGIPGNIGAGVINYITGVTVVTPGVIQITSTGEDIAGLDLVITMTPTPDAELGTTWDLDGTGCRVNNPGRGIDCRGN